MTTADLIGWSIVIVVVDLLCRFVVHKVSAELQRRDHPDGSSSEG